MVLTNAVNANLAVSVGVVTILNVPSISIGTTTVDEGSIALVGIRQSQAVSFRTSVDWATSDGTAEAPGDYDPGAGTAEFAIGETYLEVAIMTRTDNHNEGPEALVVTLSDPSNAFIGANPGTVTIVDAAIVSISDAEVPEGGLAQVHVTLSKPSAHPASVSWETARGSAASPSDFDSATGNIVFAPGQTNVSFYIQTHADATEEGDETLAVVLSGAVNIAIADGSGVVTIIDIPTISVGDAIIQEGQSADVDVSLSHVCSKPVTAQWTNPPDSATVTGGDYDSDSGDLTWQPGDLVISIHMETHPDSLEEGDEQFMVSLSGSHNALITNPTGTITIIDTPEASIGDAAIQEGGAAELTITLSGASSIPTSLSWATADGTAAAATSDYGGNFVGASGSVTFAPGQTSISFYVQTTVDGVLEGDETFSVGLADPVGLSIGDGTGVVTVLDTPTISVGASSAIEGADAAVEVCLSHASSSPVSVSWATEDGTAESTANHTDYIAGSGVITWAAGEICVALTVRTVADVDVEGDVGEQFAVVLSGPSNAMIAVGTGTVTVLEPSVDRVQTFDGEVGESGKGSKGHGSVSSVDSFSGGSKGGKGGSIDSVSGGKGGKGSKGASGKGHHASLGKQVGSAAFVSAYATHDTAAYSDSSSLAAIFGVFCVAGLGLLAVRARKSILGGDHRYDALKSFTLNPVYTQYADMPYNPLTRSPTERTPLDVSPPRSKVNPTPGIGGRGGNPGHSELGETWFSPVLV